MTSPKTRIAAAAGAVALAIAGGITAIAVTGSELPGSASPMSVSGTICADSQKPLTKRNGWTAYPSTADPLDSTRDRCEEKFSPGSSDPRFKAGGTAIVGWASYLPADYRSITSTSTTWNDIFQEHAVCSPSPCGGLGGGNVSVALDSDRRIVFKVRAGDGKSVFQQRGPVIPLETPIELDFEAHWSHGSDGYVIFELNGAVAAEYHGMNLYIGHDAVYTQSGTYRRREAFIATVWRTVPVLGSSDATRATVREAVTFTLGPDSSTPADGGTTSSTTTAGTSSSVDTTPTVPTETTPATTPTEPATTSEPATTTEPGTTTAPPPTTTEAPPPPSELDLLRAFKACATSRNDRVKAALTKSGITNGERVKRALAIAKEPC